MKKRIKLTESQLNRIIKESLNKIVSESDQKCLSDDEKRKEIISGYAYVQDMTWRDVEDALADATLIMAQWKNDCFLKMLEDLPQKNKAIYDLIEKIRNNRKNGILNENYSNQSTDDGYIVLYTDDMYVYDNSHSFLLRDICKAEYGDDFGDFSDETTFQLAQGLKMDVEHYATLRDLVEHELKDVVYQCIDSVVEDRGFYMSDINSTILPLWNKAVEKDGWVYIPLQRPVAVTGNYNEANALNEILNDEASMGVFKWDKVNVGDNSIRVTLNTHSDYVNPSFD